MPKVTSCGVVIQNSKSQILGCSPHGRHDGKHDLPKGKMDDGETPKETAIRECFEETGLDLSNINLVDLGKQKYIPKKDLHLFRCICEIDDLSQLVCTTYHEVNGSKVPEIVSYKWIDLQSAENEFFPNLVKTLKNINILC